MRVGLVINTIRHLKPQQIYFQVADRVHKPAFVYMKAPNMDGVPTITPPIVKPTCFYGEDKFCFLNIDGKFDGWENRNHGNLWAFNQNYMDWLNQDLLLDEDAEQWIDRYIAEMSNNAIGNDPYVTALRCMNWIKLFSLKPHLRSQEREDALFSQMVLMDKRLEYKLLGNHLLEEIFALFIASVYFNHQPWFDKSKTLMTEQLKEQILKDGAHYELSPMYQCILLDRLLDCYNYSINNNLFVEQDELKALMKDKAVLMLGHLESIIYQDGSFPLLNDAAWGIGPKADELFDYAKRLGLAWHAIPLTRCGYRKMKKGRMEAAVDISQIRATYQPGHTHADFFTYELRIDGVPFIVDTGTSTYDKGPRRDYERSTKAHNTVSVEEKDSCEVWSGFRVGKRPKIHIVADFEDQIEAWHKGFGKGLTHTRDFSIHKDAFCVTDKVSKSLESVSYIHFAKGVDVDVKEDLSEINTQVASIKVNGANKIEAFDETYAEEYNIPKKCKVVAIYFDKRLEYKVKL